MDNIKKALAHVKQTLSLYGYDSVIKFKNVPSDDGDSWDVTIGISKHKDKKTQTETTDSNNYYTL